MPRITMLTERELRQCVELDIDAVDIIDRAFAALAGGGVVMPPILSMAIEPHNGEVDVKTAFVPGLDGFAIKVSPGFFDNPAKGLPSLNGLMVLLDSETGVVRAVLLDNGYLTDVRTAAAGAVAARHLAPARVQVAGVVGAGVQAELQIRALQLVRPFESLQVWSRDPARASAYAARMEKVLQVPVTRAPDPRALVEAADVVVTTTPAREPVLRVEWLRAGQHVTAMGSDAAHKNELDPRVVTRADRFVCDRVSQSASVGELRTAIAAGVVPADWRPDELGEICAGLRPGRERDGDITVCDLTGTGIQDTAIATHAYRAATAAAMGTVIES